MGGSASSIPTQENVPPSQLQPSLLTRYDEATGIPYLWDPVLRKKCAVTLTLTRIIWLCVHAPNQLC